MTDIDENPEESRNGKPESQENSRERTDSNPSGYGGRYQGSGKRGEASDWYGETERKDSSPPLDPAAPSAPKP